MIGWHAVSVLAEAQAKGIEADYAAAWPAIRRRAFDPAMPDIESTLGRNFYYDLAISRPTRSGNRSVARKNMPMTTGRWRGWRWRAARRRMPRG